MNPTTSEPAPTSTESSNPNPSQIEQHLQISMEHMRRELEQNLQWEMERSIAFAIQQAMDQYSNPNQFNNPTSSNLYSPGTSRHHGINSIPNTTGYTHTSFPTPTSTAILSPDASSHITYQQTTQTENPYYPELPPPFPPPPPFITITPQSETPYYPPMYPPNYYPEPSTEPNAYYQHTYPNLYHNPSEPYYTSSKSHEVMTAVVGQNHAQLLFDEMTEKVVEPLWYQTSPFTEEEIGLPSMHFEEDDEIEILWLPPSPTTAMKLVRMQGREVNAMESNQFKAKSQQCSVEEFVENFHCPAYSKFDESDSAPLGTVEAEITPETMDFFVSETEGDPDCPTELALNTLGSSIMFQISVPPTPSSSESPELESSMDQFNNDTQQGDIDELQQHNMAEILVSSSKDCAAIESVRDGEVWHGRAMKYGVESDLFVSNSLIYMYSVCSRIFEARKVFDASPNHADLTTRNSYGPRAFGRSGHIDAEQFHESSDDARYLIKRVDEDMLLALAHSKYKAGNFKQSLEHCNVIYERNPRLTDNLLLLGAIHYQLHDFDMCIAKNDEALQIDPHFAECFGNIANAWKEKGNIDVAIHYYLVAIEVRPNFADACSNLASAYMRKGRLSEAAHCCRQALAPNPRLVDAHSNLGNLMKAQGLLQEVYNCYLEALRIQPDFVIAWSNLAGLFMESGGLNGALHYYKEAVKLRPTFSDAYLNLGNVYKAFGMRQEAIVCYQHAIQTRSDYPMGYGNLASIYYEQAQVDMAIAYYKQAIACDAGFLEAYNNLGNALKDQEASSEILPINFDGLAKALKIRDTIVIGQYLCTGSEFTFVRLVVSEIKGNDENVADGHGIKEVVASMTDEIPYSTLVADPIMPKDKTPTSVKQMSSHPLVANEELKGELSYIHHLYMCSGCSQWSYMCTCVSVVVNSQSCSWSWWLILKASIFKGLCIYGAKTANRKLKFKLDESDKDLQVDVAL